LIQLEPGTYTIRVLVPGFAPQEATGITTVSGQSLQFDATLLPSDVVVEPVVITDAGAPVIDTKRTVVGATLTARDTELLPINTRSVLDLLFTLPASRKNHSPHAISQKIATSNHANTPEEAGTFSLAGAPAYSNNLTVDGLDNNDDRSARERFQPSLEAVAEIQVITNQFSAEYGRASGGRVNLRTRSGSKEFQGRGYYFFRDEALDANTFRNNSLGLPRLPLQEHVVGFTFGGPVKRMKETVFFTSYELTKVLDSALIDTLVPVKQSTLFSLPAPTRLERLRLEDANAPALAAEVAPFVSSIQHAHEKYEHHGSCRSPVCADAHGGVCLSGGTIHQPETVWWRQSFGRSLSGTTTQFRRDLLLRHICVLGDARESVAISSIRVWLPLSKPTPVNAPVVLIALNDPLLAGDPERRAGTLVAGSSTSGGSDRREERLQVQDVLSLVNGNHSLKLGVDFHHVRSTFIDLADITGTYNFASAGDFLAGVPSRFRQNFQSSSTQRNRYTGVFVQDEWQILPQLLLSFGLRYEYETILRDLNNFGPRFSLAYSPFDSGKLVLRAGGRHLLQSTIAADDR
jgi:outer membrane receptor protein involved in Fe transport